MGLIEDVFLAIFNCLCAGSKAANSDLNVDTNQNQHELQRPTYAAAVGTQPHANETQVYQQPSDAVRPHGHAKHQQPFYHPPSNHQKPDDEAPAPRFDHPSHIPHVDLNQINQHNGQYTALRSQAHEEGEKMSKCFHDSHEAYNQGDHALAKELSDQGKEHESKMDRLNKQASDWIFVENNKDSKPGELDLHGLFVKEAIEHTDEAIQAAQQRGDSEIHLIVGKGLHSPQHVAKLKPAVEELLDKHRLVAELDPDNSGVIIVHLTGTGRRRDLQIGADEITRRLEDHNEDCVIM